MLAKINWTPNKKDLRKFGLALVIGFALIGLVIFYWKSQTVAKWIWAGGCGAGVWAIIFPQASKPLYWLWMGVAFILGNIVSYVILTVIFYFLITPVGLIMRLLKRDSLKLKKSSFDGGTFWSHHPELKSKEYYRRLF